MKTLAWAIICSAWLFAGVFNPTKERKEESAKRGWAAMLLFLFSVFFFVACVE